MVLKKLNLKQQKQTCINKPKDTVKKLTLGLVSLYTSRLDTFLWPQDTWHFLLKTHTK